jgi:hypothetical protein
LAGSGRGGKGDRDCGWKGNSRSLRDDKQKDRQRQQLQLQQQMQMQMQIELQITG